MDRRYLIKAFGAIAASSAFLSACGKAEEGGEQKIGHTPSFYTPALFAFVSRVADALIPTTETPGAVAVGVPQMLDHLMVDWADDETREKHLADWQLILTTLAVPAETPNEEFAENVRLLDAVAFTTERAQYGGYRRQKSLIAQAYYWSEPGATQELQYELNPEELIVCGPIEEIGRTWFR